MPYKDPYREYLRQYEKRMNQGEHLKELHIIWRNQNRQKVIAQGKEAKRKFKEKHPELVKKQAHARHASAKIPMKDYCELCPEEDNKEKKLTRHHPDYDYPTIFVTTCPICHRWITLEELYESEKVCRGNDHL
jgi:hypothetical protein